MDSLPNQQLGGENHGPADTIAKAGQSSSGGNSFDNELGPEDYKYQHDLRLLKVMAEKDRSLHIYFYHGVSMPGTEEYISRVDLLGDIAVLQSNSLVQFWREVSDKTWKKLAHFERDFAKGQCLYSDWTRRMKDKNTLIYSDIWFIDGLTEMYAEDTVIVLHMCICRKNGDSIRRIVPIRLSGKFVDAAHCVLPNKSILLAATYLKPANCAFATDLRNLFLKETMYGFRTYKTWGVVEGNVCSVGFSRQHKNYVVVHCDPCVNIFNRKTKVMYAANLEGTLHKLKRGHVRHMRSVNTDGQEMVYMTFRSTDGVVEEIAHSPSEKQERMVRKFSVSCAL